MNIKSEDIFINKKQRVWKVNVNEVDKDDIYRKKEPGFESLLLQLIPFDTIHLL